jgi:copper chaperone CopZ
MKHILMMVLAIIGMTSPARSDTKPSAHDIVISVNGMVCDVCAQSIKKTFLKEDTVQDVMIDLDAKTVSIDLKDKATMDDDTIKKLVDHSGYDVVKIVR